MSQEVEMHICLGSSCFSRGNKEVVMYIKEYLWKHHLEDKIIFKGARCMGHCSKGPNIKLQEHISEGITMTSVEIFLEHELMRYK